MPSIDAILDRMTERNAEGLSLRVGEIPTVRAAGRQVAVQKVPLSAAQVVAITREIAPREAADHIDRGEPCSFEYREFEVLVTFSHAGPSVEVLPKSAALVSLQSFDPMAGFTPVPAPKPHDPTTDIKNAPSLGHVASVRKIELDLPDGQMRPSSRSPSASVRANGAQSSTPSAHPASLSPAVRVAPQANAAAVWEKPTLVSRRMVLIGAGVAGVLALGAVAWCARPVRVPNVVMADASGKPVTFDDMRQSKGNLLVVFMMPNDPISRFVIASIKTSYEKASKRVAFVGLYYGSSAEAAKAGEDLGVPFPMYGLKDSKDPFALQELFKKAGASTLIGASMYGGTTILLDDQNKIVFKLEKEEVQTLPEKLQKLCE